MTDYQVKCNTSQLQPGRIHEAISITNISKVDDWSNPSCTRTPNVLRWVQIMGWSFCINGLWWIHCPIIVHEPLSFIGCRTSYSSPSLRLKQYSHINWRRIRHPFASKARNIYERYLSLTESNPTIPKPDGNWEAIWHPKTSHWA